MAALLSSLLPWIVGALEGDLGCPPLHWLDGWLPAQYPACLGFPPACPGHVAKPLAVEALLWGLDKRSHSVAPATTANLAGCLLPGEHNLHHVCGNSQLGG